MNRRDFALYLALTPGIGGKTLTRILTRNDVLSRSPEEFLSLSPEAMREEYRLKAAPATQIALSGVRGVDGIREMQERLDKLGVGLVTANDANYPVALEQMDPDPPGVLFLYGNAKLVRAKTYCVLSSRNTSPAGLSLLEKLAEEAVLAGEVVVSGHDTDEYRRSAIVPLRWGAPRVLCLDRGLFQALGPDLKDEPFRAARLWRFQFDPGTDLVVSPVRPEAAFTSGYNRRRDRLIGGLSSRLDFIEIQPGGNMEKLALAALKAGRKVRVSDRSVEYRRLADLGAEILPA